MLLVVMLFKLVAPLRVVWPFKHPGSPWDEFLLPVRPTEGVDHPRTPPHPAWLYVGNSMLGLSDCFKLRPRCPSSPLCRHLHNPEDDDDIGLGWKPTHCSKTLRPTAILPD